MKNIDPFINVGDSFANKLENKSPGEISTEVSYMTLSEHLFFVAEILNKLEINLEGVGMEIAAGASIFSNSLARIYPNIVKIQALEIVSEMVTKLQPKIIKATNMTDRVIPIVGDFNDIKMPNSSLDFIVEFDSLHHSNDLKRTLTEIVRVLKPGGKLICFDRAHPNHMTKAQENFLLNTEYSNNYKIQHGLKIDKPYKRSDNGEHEPRICDWEKALIDTNLQLDTIAIFSKRNLKDFLKILAAHIPYKIRASIKKGRGLTAHNKLLLYYLFPFFTYQGKIKIFPFYTKFKTPTAPMRKMVLIFSKIK